MNSTTSITTKLQACGDLSVILHPDNTISLRGTPKPFMRLTRSELMELGGNLIALATYAPAPEPTTEENNDS
jgi:hypothetical protein